MSPAGVVRRVEDFRALAAEAGFRAVKLWRDRRGLFALHGLLAA